MRRLVLATRNRGKIGELRALLADLEVAVVGLDDYPELPEVEEDGDTFEANARKKARAIAAGTGLPALADDSGLVVDRLEGEPGVFSARYGGPGLDDAGRCRHLLARLADRGVDRSPARFRCVVVLIDAHGREHASQGVWEGEVHGPPSGTHGFGYDPIFWLPDREVTAAMLPAAEKNRLSHRGQAVARMVEVLRRSPDLLGPQ